MRIVLSGDTFNRHVPGRKRTKAPDERRALSNACDIVENVRERGIYKARTPEGKAGRKH